MSTTCHSPHCPHLARLAHTKVYYRAQQAEIVDLHERLRRYQHLFAHIGVRRWSEKEARQRLAGTDTLYQLTILRRAVQQRDAQIQHQACIIQTLHDLLTASEISPPRPTVAPPPPATCAQTSEIVVALHAVQQTLEVQP